MAKNLFHHPGIVNHCDSAHGAADGGAIRRVGVPCVQVEVLDGGMGMRDGAVAKFAPVFRFQLSAFQLFGSWPVEQGTLAQLLAEVIQKLTGMLDLEEAVQLMDAGGVSHLAQGLGLDLPDAFAGDPVLPADLLQRARIAVP